MIGKTDINYEVLFYNKTSYMYKYRLQHNCGLIQNILLIIYIENGDIVADIIAAEKQDNLISYK